MDGELTIVDRFIYSGSFLTKNGSMGLEVITHVSLRPEQHMLNSGTCGVASYLKCHVCCTTVHSALFYGCEAGMLKMFVSWFSITGTYAVSLTLDGVTG